MFGLGKKGKNKDGMTAQKVDRVALQSSLDSALDNWATESNTDQLLAETGKTYQQLLDAVLTDDEVEACREDLRTAIIAEPWRLFTLENEQGEGEQSETTEKDINRLYKLIRKHINSFAELAILARFGGYAVAEYVYRQEADGFWTIDSILSREGELDYYTIGRDGSVKFTGDESGQEKLIDRRVKNLVLTSRAVPARPHGELMIIRAYPAVAMRKRGWAYAGQFIARYAQPYVVGKQGNSYANDTKSFTSTIFGFLNGGATGIGKDDEIDIHQLTGDGEAFERLERQANRRIQKLLLGRVKTSELTSGSRASQQTDDQTRQDRISAYLDLMVQAIQHCIDAVILVNSAYGVPINAPSGIWFEYQRQSKPDKDRAKVDKIYFDTGVVKPTEAYFSEFLGWEEGHFEMVSVADNPPPFQGGARGGLPLSEPNANNTPYPPSLLLANKAGEGVAGDDKYATLMQPKIQALLSAVSKADGYEGFSALLDEIEKHGFDNSDLIDDLSAQLADEYVNGLVGEGEDED